MTAVIYVRRFSSPLGTLTGASDGENILGLWIAGQKYFESTVKESPAEENLPVFDKMGEWLDRYFVGEQPGIGELPLAPEGSVFRRTVWNCLKEIPYGETAFYGEIADKVSRLLGRRTSPRAVGVAVGRNPISIIVPCHRVIGADGGLTGYAGGLDIKLRLLRHEGVQIDFR